MQVLKIKKVISLIMVMLLFTISFGGCGAAEEGKNSADTIITGKILTLDKDGTQGEAVAIMDGIIQYVGDLEGVKTYQGKETEMIEAADGLVMPAFGEGHGHGHQGGVGNLFEVFLFEGTSMEDYEKTIKTFLDANQDIEFLTGTGWMNGYCPTTGPTKEVLDKINSEIPIVINSADFHSKWVNSKAMEIAGIDANTPDVPGGVIERDPVTKEPTGTFRENARVLLEGVIPEYSVEQYKEGIFAYQKEAITYGIASYFEPMVNLSGEKNLFQAYNELDREGKLLMRVYGGYQILPEKDPMGKLDTFLQMKEEAKGGDFEMVAVKILVDGVVEGKTAYLLEDYTSDPGFKGEPLWEPDMLKEFCLMADEKEITVHTHAIGDAAVKITVDAYEKVQEENGDRDRRNAITHLQLVQPDDIVRMGKLNVIASVNTYWFCKEPGYFEELEIPFLGEVRANQEYPMKSFIDAGSTVVLASDYPVTTPAMPLDAIQKGVTRCNIKGDASTLLNPKEIVTLDQMLDAATKNVAYQNFAEAVTGTIEVGKSADILILEKDITAVEPTEIAGLTVLRTMFKGDTVFKK